MVEDVKTGKEKVIPFDVKEFHKDISNLETILNYSIQMKDYDWHMTEYEQQLYDVINALSKERTETKEESTWV